MGGCPVLDPPSEDDEPPPLAQFSRSYLRIILMNDNGPHFSIAMGEWPVLDPPSEDDEPPPLAQSSSDDEEASREADEDDVPPPPAQYCCEAQCEAQWYRDCLHIGPIPSFLLGLEFRVVQEGQEPTEEGQEPGYIYRNTSHEEVEEVD
jgi:hypothetical protein